MRDHSIDSVCGLLIIHVILGHIFQWAHMNSLYSPVALVLSFFMPWFFYKSGMYYKERPVGVAFELYVRKLIFPYLAFSIIGQIFWTIMMFVEGDRVLRHYMISPFNTLLAEGSLNGNLPLWFLFSLFAVLMCFSLFKKNKLVLCFIALLCALILHFTGVVKPYWIANICSGLFFFSIGYYLKERQYRFYLFAISLIATLTILLLLPSFVDMRSNALLYGNYVVWYIYSIAAIISINNIFKYLRIPILTKVFTYIGENSMIFYVLHWIIMTIVMIVSLICNCRGDFAYIAILANIIILPLMTYVVKRSNNKYVRLLFGLK